MEKKHRTAIKEVRYMRNGEQKSFVVGDTFASYHSSGEITAIDVQSEGGSLIIFVLNESKVLVSIVSPEIELYY